MVTTIQNPNQLPREWSGFMRAASATTLADAQKWADANGADAYWIEPSKTVYALPKVAQEQDRNG